jgi:hypothetical protein
LGQRWGSRRPNWTHNDGRWRLRGGFSLEKAPQLFFPASGFLGLRLRW